MSMRHARNRLATDSIRCLHALRSKDGVINLTSLSSPYVRVIRSLKDILGLLRVDSEERDVWTSIATNRVISRLFIPIFLQATALLNELRESEGDLFVISRKIESLEIIRATIIKILVLVTMPINPDLSLITHNIKTMEDLDIKDVFQLPLNYGKVYHEIENCFVFVTVPKPSESNSDHSRVGPLYFTPTDSTAKNFYIALGNMVMSLLPDGEDIDSVMAGEEEDVVEEVDEENHKGFDIDELESEDDSFEVRDSESEEEEFGPFEKKESKSKKTIVIRRKKFLQIRFAQIIYV
jgi:hypothetical protein